jgi:hypothetical protein
MPRQADFILRSRSIPFLLGLALLVPCGTALAQAEFRRGDVDGSGAVNIGDVHPLMAWLFFGESAPTCWDTADADADGAIDLSDVYHILDWLLKGTEIPAPGPLVCGTGTGASIGCNAYDCGARVTPPSTDLLELGFLLGGQVPGGPGREVFCTLTHSGGDAVVGWSFGVAAEGGRITRVTMEGADVEGVFSEHGRGGFEITHGAGNEGAVSLAMLIATRPVTFPSSSMYSIAKLTVEPSPGAAEVILRHVDGLQGSGQPISTLVATVKRPVVPRTAPLAIPCSDCSSSGDTHCFQLHVDGPDEGYDENTPGTYSVTARALDDSGDPAFFTFRAERSGAPPLVSGPQSENQAFFDLDEGSWTISVAVDDAHWCSEAAFDSTCTEQVIVSLHVAATLVVDLHGTGDFTDIQSALDAARDGDLVLVKPGEYVVAEPINFNSDRSLLGRGARNPDDPASPPVKNIEVKSEGGAQVTTIRMAEMPTEPNRASVVVFEHEESGASRLDGFTVTGSRGTQLS